ncbi:hypothetical protein GCM10011325_08960 [Dyadobacter sediminis]|nr:hypothetical protein GCM10011325_08960 [Dyadobacter sediminis]
MLVLLFYSANLFAQPVISWDKTYGGNEDDVLEKLELTTDGGYILGGTSKSGISGEKSQAGKGSADYWIVKISADGTKEWDQTYGGSGYDQLIAIHQTSDGGYILGGRSDSDAGGDKSSDDRSVTEGGKGDYWIVKISSDGTKQWDKTIGGTGSDFLTSVKQTPDKGYILAGFSQSGKGADKSQDALETSFPHDNWIVKLSENGDKEWDKTFGTKYYDYIVSLEITADGGYFVAGNSNATGSAFQWYLARFAADGSMQWEKFIPTNGLGGLTVGQTTSDGGYILGVTTELPNQDYVVVKLDASANLVWNKSYSGKYFETENSIENLVSITQTKDGGYIIGGYSNGDAGNEKSQNSKGVDDYWIVKIAEDGTKQWDKTIGGLYIDYFSGLVQTSDGGYLLGGSSESWAGADKTEGYRGGSDFWIVKLAPETENQFLVFSSGLLNVTLENGTTTASQSVNLAASADSTAVTFTKSENSDWLTIPSASLGKLTFGMDATGLAPGKYTATVTAAAAGYISATLTVKLTVKPANTGTTVRINAGGGAYTTADGKVFEADKYNGGLDRTNTIGNFDILKTEDDELYRSERSAQSFSYNIPVTNGEYVVVLHFAEIYFGAPGGVPKGLRQRLFNIDFEGVNRADEYNIIAYAGGPMTAVEEEYTNITVSDGILNIDFLNAGANQPSVAAIEVIPSSEYVNRIVLPALADVHVRDGEFANQNFGASGLLEVKSGSEDVTRNTYLQFSVRGLLEKDALISAKLRIYGYNAENTGKTNVSAYGIDNNEWTESGITWENAPVGGFIPLSYADVNDEAKYYELDVTEHVRAQFGSGRIVSILLKNPTDRNRKLYFHSKENPSGNAPQLVILTTAPYFAETRINQEITSPAAFPKSENGKSTVYPNPVKKQFTLKLSDKHEGAVSLQLISRLGRAYDLALPQQKSAKTEVDLSGLSLNKGLYLLKVRSAAATEVLKVLVTE